MDLGGVNERQVFRDERIDDLGAEPDVAAVAIVECRRADRIKHRIEGGGRIIGAGRVRGQAAVAAVRVPSRHRLALYWCPVGGSSLCNRYCGSSRARHVSQVLRNSWNISARRSRSSRLVVEIAW